MRYHLILSKPLDFEQVERETAAGLRPDHVLVTLARRMNMRVHAPDAENVKRPDVLRSKLCGTPELWALARRVMTDIEPGDVLLCNGEDVGLPIALASARHGPHATPQHAWSSGVRVAAVVHNLDRPRMRVALQWLRWGRDVDLWITPCSHQADFLQTRVGVPRDNIRVVPDRTDVDFFSPGPRPAAKRPVIVSVGLEGRDYRTLAHATADMDVDVRISGFSTDARAARHAFPENLPTNMSRRFYEWTELAELYRSADVVVVSLFHRTYAAGITTLLEGLASGRPVIVTETRGLHDYIAAARAGGVAVPAVHPGDHMALRAAIQQILHNPAYAERLASSGRAYALRHHTSPRWIEQMEAVLRQLARETKPVRRADELPPVASVVNPMVQ